MIVEWDAGDIGCGELVLELRSRMRALTAGQTLRLIARDPGAPADLPAWCRMTGHALLSAQPPVYLIKKPDEFPDRRAAEALRSHPDGKSQGD